MKEHQVRPRAFPHLASAAGLPRLTNWRSGSAASLPATGPGFDGNAANGPVDGAVLTFLSCSSAPRGAARTSARITRRAFMGSSVAGSLPGPVPPAPGLFNFRKSDIVVGGLFLE